MIDPPWEEYQQRVCGIDFKFQTQIRPKYVTIVAYKQLENCGFTSVGPNCYIGLTAERWSVAECEYKFGILTVFLSSLLLRECVCVEYERSYA